MCFAPLTCLSAASISCCNRSCSSATRSASSFIASLQSDLRALDNTQGLPRKNAHEPRTRRRRTRSCTGEPRPLRDSYKGGVQRSRNTYKENRRCRRGAKTIDQVRQAVVNQLSLVTSSSKRRMQSGGDGDLASWNYFLVLHAAAALVSSYALNICNINVIETSLKTSKLMRPESDYFPAAAQSGKSDFRATVPWMQSGGGSAGGGGHQPTSGGGGQAANTTTGGGTGDDEAPKDPGARITHQSYTESDFEGHRAHTVFVGVHLPGERRHRRHHKHHHSRGSNGSAGKEEPDIDRPITPPAQRVQFILGEEVGDDAHESHPLFSEMEELCRDGDELMWKETARWIKFEEDVEEGGNRWSKPHVATLSLHSLFELRSLLLNGTVILDMEASGLEQITDLVLDNMISKNDLSIDVKDQGNVHFMRKIPPGAEASNILVGEVEFLDKSISAFIRLSQANIMGDLTEVPVPTRFIFILLGPVGGIASFHEIGRAMATLMSDEVFHEVAYKAKNKTHLLSGIDEFLDAVTVLPPGEWDPTIRIEPPAAIPSQEIRKRPKDEKIKEEVDEEADEQKLREESGLSRTGKLFGGLVNDIKRKKPFYLSDFKDACSLQCIASFIFLYFACLSPIITFGGLLSEATGKNMAAMESLVSGFVCGEGYALFSGQPLTILGSTGPVLVFESIVYEFCQKCGWHYMSFRFWIGTWMAVILLILVAVDASALVCFITRFTEENFATLIAFIFIYKAIENVMSIRKKFPVSTGQNLGNSSCFCGPPGTSLNSSYSTTSNQYSNINWASLDKYACQAANGTVIGENCFSPPPVPDVFLMSIILFAGTFLISIHLKDFKNALFFPAKVRQIISDFAVIIAIFSMTALDASVGIDTPKLEVPSEFKPTLDGRGWIIMPFNHNPWWSAVVAVLPALLGTILVFMDQQITAVIVNRKENKLKKGCGYHLDLFVLALLIQLCSFMGLPWFVAATVLSINHVNSLKLESECAAPGEKPQFLGVREQRVTAILIFLMIGCSVLLTPMLKHIPMPVLFGVFLYMGVASLKGLQFFDRILIIFMPQKYQPDYMFLRQVPIRKVHLFTAIQLACLICLWTIKSFSITSIFFPLMLVVMIGIRKSLDLIFTQRDLKILDDVMPEYHKKHADDLRQLENGETSYTVPKRISTWMLQSNCFYALANFIIVSNAAFGSQVITILRTLEKVTRKLPKSELDKVAKWICIKDLIVYALLIVHAPALFSGDIYNWIAKVIASYATTVIYLLDLQYSSYVYILGSCFKFINAELARLKDKAFTEKAHLLRRVYHHRFNPTLFVKLRHLKQWHYELNEAIRKINLTFSLQIISTLILTFTELTFGLYFNIYDMRHKNIRSLNNEVWYCYYYTLVVYYTLKLFLLTLTCQFTNDENDKSHIIINEILINTDDKLFKEELKASYFMWVATFLDGQGDLHVSPHTDPVLSLELICNPQPSPLSRTRGCLQHSVFQFTRSSSSNCRADVYSLCGVRCAPSTGERCLCSSSSSSNVCADFWGIASSSSSSNNVKTGKNVYQSRAERLDELAKE
ncbi:unnamed protein product, partial [Trichogramma brassicae]